MDPQADRLQAFPVRPGSVWQGRLVELPAKVLNEHGDLVVPAIFLWADVATGRVAPGEIEMVGEPTDVSLEPIEKFAVEMGYRPDRLEVVDPKLAAALVALVRPLGTTVEVVERLDAVEPAAESLSAQMAMGGTTQSGKTGTVPDGLTDDPSITPERAGRFAEAAALFFTAAPWDLFDATDVIKVASPKVQKHLRFVNVMGGGGQEFGLGLFESLSQFDELVSGDPQSFTERHKMVSVTFDTDELTPPADLAAWSRHRWPTGLRKRKKIYPFPVIYNRGVWVRPTAEELSTMEGLLRALAVVTDENLDAGTWEAGVETADGPVKYRFEFLGLEVDPLEQVMQSAGPLGPFGGAADLPASKAERLLEQSLQARGPKAFELAARAIEADPQMVDAYNRLGDLTPDAAVAIDIYKRAVEVAERVLGKRAFKEFAGAFWGFHETRPYMRALAGLAGAHDRAGQTDAAIDIWQRMLELNPGDNQGMRDPLAAVLAKGNRNDELAALLAKYPDDWSVTHAYCEALLSFRTQGDVPASADKLRRAIGQNPHLVAYLTGSRRLPASPPAYYSPGTQDEADCFAADLKPGWQGTPGAVDWLTAHAPPKPKAKVVKVAKKKATRPRKPR